MRWRRFFRDPGGLRDTGIVNPQPALREYGGDRTIHQTNHLSVEVNAAGEVVSVWFRCQSLPFKQSFADSHRAGAMRRMYNGQPHPDIISITLQDKRK